MRRTWQAKLVWRLRGESLGDEWRSVRRQRFGANTPRSGKGWIVLDSRIDFCWTWSFTFSSNHSIIANGWTLSEQMAINLTGLIPLRYLSCVSAASATLRLTQTGIAAHAHTHTYRHTYRHTHAHIQHRQQNTYKHWHHILPESLHCTHKNRIQHATLWCALSPSRSCLYL